MLIGLAILWAFIALLLMFPNPILGTIVLIIICMFNIDIVAPILFWIVVFGAGIFSLALMDDN